MIKTLYEKNVLKSHGKMSIDVQSVIWTNTCSMWHDQVKTMIEILMWSNDLVAIGYTLQALTTTHWDLYYRIYHITSHGSKLMHYLWTWQRVRELPLKTTRQSQ